MINDVGPETQRWLDLPCPKCGVRNGSHKADPKGEDCRGAFK